MGARTSRLGFARWASTSTHARLSTLVASVLVALLVGAGDATAFAGAHALDLHTVDWQSVSVPGAACFNDQPIVLRHGGALLPNPNGYPMPGRAGPSYYTIDRDGPTVYGALAGTTVAVVALMCTNNGGTGDGILLTSLAVFTGSGGRLTPAGLLTPIVQPLAPATRLDGARISDDSIRVLEDWYGPGDHGCCPTGRATTAWKYRGSGRAFLPRTTITRQPTSEASFEPAGPAGDASVDLHAVHWKEVSIPGETCDSATPIRLHQGWARIPNADGFPDTVGGPTYYGVGLDRITYGLLPGGVHTAAMTVSCTNNGGTADSLRYMSVVMFTAHHGTVVPLAVLAPIVQPAQTEATLLEATFDHGTIVLTEAWHGTYDHACCGTGRARTVWRYTPDRVALFSPRTTVTRQPAARLA